MRPVAELDRAAAEIAKQNYDYRIDVRSQDELGRLAGTFQSMCESIRQARQELIRRERISTIGQLSTSIVHDLRNPLAAIYAGAEMMMDSAMSQEMTQRLARNIYRASRGIQDMLQELLDVVRGTSSGSEMCSLREVIAAAWNTVAPSAERASIALELSELPTAWNVPWSALAWSACSPIFLRMRLKPCVPAAASPLEQRHTATTSWSAWRIPGRVSARRCRAVCSSRL